MDSWSNAARDYHSLPPVNQLNTRNLINSAHFDRNRHGIDAVHVDAHAVNRYDSPRGFQISSYPEGLGANQLHEGVKRSYLPQRDVRQHSRASAHLPSLSHLLNLPTRNSTPSSHTAGHDRDFQFSSTAPYPLSQPPQQHTGLPVGPLSVPSQPVPHHVHPIASNSYHPLPGPQQPQVPTVLSQPLRPISSFPPRLQHSTSQPPIALGQNSAPSSPLHHATNALFPRSSLFFTRPLSPGHEQTPSKVTKDQVQVPEALSHATWTVPSMDTTAQNMALFGSPSTSAPVTALRVSTSGVCMPSPLPPSHLRFEERLGDQVDPEGGEDSPLVLPSGRLDSPLPLAPPSGRLDTPLPLAPPSGRLGTPLPLALPSVRVDTPLPPLPSIPAPGTEPFVSPINSEEHSDGVSAETPFLQADDSTHALRLGPQARLQPMARTNKKLSDAQKATKALSQEASKKKRADLLSAIDAQIESHNTVLKEIARIHGVKFQYVKDIITHSPHFKQRRAPSAWNAKLKAVKRDLDEAGISASAAEIREKAREPEYENATKEQVQGWIAQVQDDRLNAKLGARRDNKAAAIDFRGFMKRAIEEATGLEARTGAAVITIAAPSDVSDTFMPAWGASQNALSFANDILGMSIWDLTRKLQQWACLKKKDPKLSIVEMQKECAHLITQGLHKITQRDTVNMNYVNYEKSIVCGLGVKMEGWTYKEVVTPLLISSRADIEALLQALQTGACYWVQLTSAEVRAHAKAIATREANGEVVGKKRKTRSDKGVSKGARSKKRTRRNSNTGKNAAGDDGACSDSNDEDGHGDDGDNGDDDGDNSDGDDANNSGNARVSSRHEATNNDESTNNNASNPESANNGRKKTNKGSRQTARKTAGGKENRAPHNAQTRGRRARAQLPPSVVRGGPRSRSFISSTDDEGSDAHGRE